MLQRTLVDRAASSASSFAQHFDVTRAHHFLANRLGKTSRPAKSVLGDMPRRIYQATPEKVWVNDVVERDDSRIDVRVEIDLVLLRADRDPVRKP